MRGGLTIGLLLCLAASSCASPKAETKIRAAGATPVSGTTAAGNAELALGNVALAMENYRKAVRENAGDLQAMSGMAVCYERMGRSDLAQKWLETALAVMPDSPELLSQLADVLDSEGNRDEAIAVRAEATLNARIIAGATNQAQHSALASRAKPAASVTVVLPAAAPIPRNSQAAAAIQASNDNSAAAVFGPGPHLERLSLGEVALVTTREPVWRAMALSGQRLAVRYVPLQDTARLLNAARAQGLAARTRERLLGHGWKKIEIGDAPAVRDRTLVLYPASQRAKAERLVAELGVGTVQPSFAAQITVLLGRDIMRPGGRRQA